MSRISKRKRFLASSFILSLGFIGINFLPEAQRFMAIGFLGFLAFILFVFSLWEGLGINQTLLTLILPPLFTVGVGLFWFLLPSNFLAKVPVIIFFGLGIYALCLTLNIYTVSAIRTIALLRAARGVGFVITLVTLFLIFDTIISLRLPFYFSSLLVFVVSFLLFLQGYWSIPLEKEFSFKLLRLSLVSALIVGEIEISLFFWPVSVAVGSLLLTTTSYMLLGLGQAYLEERLFAQTVREYLLVGIAVFFGMFLVTRWGG